MNRPILVSLRARLLVEEHVTVILDLADIGVLPELYQHMSLAVPALFATGEIIRLE